MAKFEVGQIWRAKTPRNVAGLVNDRVIRYVGMYNVQYDGPSVANGRKYPLMKFEDFEKWAGRLLDPSELPPGTWAEWDFKNSKKNK